MEDPCSVFVHSVFEDKPPFNPIIVLLSCAKVQQMRRSSLACFAHRASVARFIPSAARWLPSHHTDRWLASTSSLSSSTSALSGADGTLSDSLESMMTTPGGIVTSVVGVVSLVLYLKYQRAIRKRLQQVQDESWIFGAGVTMERAGDTDANLFPNLQFLNVNPSFVEENPDCPMTSLGDYLQSLRPKQLPKNVDTKDLPTLIQRELEAGLATVLLKALGPNLGRALLPAVGVGPIQNQVQKVGVGVASRWLLSNQAVSAEHTDKASLPISILSLLALSESNAKFSSGSANTDKEKKRDTEEAPPTSVKDGTQSAMLQSTLSAMDKMKVGEHVSGPTFNEDMVPTSGFILEQDFHSTIQKMEQVLRDEGDGAEMSSTELQTAQADLKDDEEDQNESEDNASLYNPNDRSMGKPIPINPRLFPDLHLGYGDAKCSHTKRQVLQMRLLAILLNRLGSNYHRIAKQDKDDLFSIQLTKDGPTITNPADMIQGLMEMGHEITVVPTSRITSFGIGMCIREADDSWTSVPLGVFLESGYEDEHNNMAPAIMPHSGVRLIFGDGPLTKNLDQEYDDHDPSSATNPLIIQHFIGIEGFCGWKSDHNPEVPFNENVESGSPLKDSRQVGRAVRLAGLYANVLNGLATELELPFGGYGVTAVCNDSAAMLQQCLYGESYIFPLTSLGRYMQRTLRYNQVLSRELKAVSRGTMKDELEDLEALQQAMLALPSDINATPANAPDAARRLLHTMQPERPLALMDNSKTIMENILQEHKEHAR